MLNDFENFIFRGYEYLNIIIFNLKIKGKNYILIIYFDKVTLQPCVIKLNTLVLVIVNS